jgi:hypothetical protein
MIEHEKLLQVLHYNPETGVFIWASPRPKIQVGDEAGYVKKNKGYRYIEIDGASYSGHRLAWFFVHKEWPEKQVDHINRDRADNRISNLRLASHGENRANSKTTNKHGYKGVNYKKWLKEKPWSAQITHNKKVIYLGCFSTPEEAHFAYCRKAKELHGDFFNGG